MVLRWREDNHPGDPETNMAVDGGLLEELISNPSALPIIRLYQWDRRSVSMGRLQEEKAVRRAFPELPIVRRPTGGRAVLHGSDLTVTVVVRETELPIRAETSQGVLSSYRQIVRGLLIAFQSLGIAAQLGGETLRHLDRSELNCFALAASCDIVEVRTLRKLVGCAQRRQHGVILQQASIPLARLPEADVVSSAIKAGMQEALGVKRWISVDTVYPV